ncbi:amidohydrolase family protein [Brevibacterium sp. 91QC2O2]|uniref:amidohydrolase family protein n=1 Tax=Brevibacterium sp. 91QC2O2 TaxID=2968458 RepID=UPI00211C918D|nr:amidohydrolase family protein [Brevibacterium sp. 91QC2O2]MCQ9367117.1 amidohydrolase family protein [Brevibacterium sp. 91QC2O2]
MFDAHLHLWDRNRFAYPWMDGNADLPQVSAPGAPGFPDADFPVGAVFVEAGVAAAQRLDEVAWVADLAPAAGIRGIVAAVDLLDTAALAGQLAALREFPLVVGVRDNFEGLPAGVLAERLPGLLAVLSAGLRVDVCIRHEQAAELAGLLEAVAAQRGDASGVVLDHIAKPGLEDLAGVSEAASAAEAAAQRSAVLAAARDAWLPGIRRLATIESLAVKISGLPGQVPGPVTGELAGQLAQTFLPPLLEAFGPDRVLFGSDHPVSTLAHGLDYRVWFGALHLTLAGILKADELEAVLSDNALRFYGLADLPTDEDLPADDQAGNTQTMKESR